MLNGLSEVLVMHLRRLCPAASNAAAGKLFRDPQSQTDTFGCETQLQA